MEKKKKSHRYLLLATIRTTERSCLASHDNDNSNSDGADESNRSSSHEDKKMNDYLYAWFPVMVVTSTSINLSSYQT